MNTPAAKRRRVDAANKTLRKPFHSPLLNRRPGTGDESTPGSSKTPEPNANKQPSEDVYSPCSPSVSKQPQAVRPARSLGNLHHTRPASPLKLSIASGPPQSAKRKATGSGEDDVGPDHDNPFLALVRAHKTAGRDAVMKDLDRRLDTVEQARKIEAASEESRPGEPVDQELRDLIAKWKGASRLAAEELFETVKERVDNAGGSKAWKEMQQRQLEFYQGFDQESPSKSKVSDEDFESEYSQDVQSHLKEGRRAQKAENVPDEDDEPEFNMAHMLHSLNIDLSLLGYDEKEDKWTNET
ncbi:hypothetical protein J7T55_002803 [Diaporthe amygdali]|uniref:uncharacterized protein n=1 Tax=Phomopsis amygdali TaxID=1214568 RepID=UPI0022FECF54|nr:uncharacterized protein J7T55_002803 [Diaporthe amygdali]KAJ0122290.1 hypothetical protein J7T55_002803 [Diaporthe amygdali]